MPVQRGIAVASPLDQDYDTATQQSAQKVGARRVHSYDLYRGLLLVSMFVWHVILNLATWRWRLEADYFRWISMGFVMFLGVGLARFLQHKTRKKVSLALKLFATFYLLNIPNYFADDFSPWLLITGSQLYLSFEVLFPMGVLILLSIPLDRLSHRAYVPAILVYLVIVTLNLTGVYAYNGQILLYGLFGYFLAKDLDLDRIAQQTRLWATFVAAAVCSIPFVLRRFGPYFDFLFIPYILALYLIVARWIKSNRALEFIGRNSFVIYVGQIVLVKALAVMIYKTW